MGIPLFYIGTFRLCQKVVSFTLRENARAQSSIQHLVSFNNRQYKKGVFQSWLTGKKLSSISRIRRKESFDPLLWIFVNAAQIAPRKRMRRMSLKILAIPRIHTPTEELSLLRRLLKKFFIRFYKIRKSSSNYAKNECETTFKILAISRIRLQTNIVLIPRCLQFWHSYKRLFLKLSPFLARPILSSLAS